MNSGDGLRIEVLGPVEAWVNGRQVALGGQRPRALLAALALMRGRVMTSERLIDELWGDAPPARARDSLRMHVSRLRKALAEAGDTDRLVGRAGGYSLDLEPGSLDVDRWEAALGRARRARADGRIDDARIAIEEALGVWRGAPLEGASRHELLDAEGARLEEERLAAAIEAIELDLELGRHGELLGRLEALVIAHPFKERLVELQMLALYRSGRQADALAAFHHARARFVEELGIEPGQALRGLHEDVLRQADTLDAESAAARPAARSERRLPVPPNRTIGRSHDVEAIGERLGADVRLLTLTGPGGVGKTRLALEAARRLEQDFADGACFVPLAALQRPDDVPAAIVAALGTIILSGESPARAAERFLATKHLLLLVDNCEHVLAAAPVLGRLLELCPALRVLATSREPLSLQAEERFPVSPLALPDPVLLVEPEALASVDAVALFVDRARAHDRDFDLAEADPVVVAEICRRLDGLPLAIELAAARCGVLSAREIAERLEATLGALGDAPRDAPARQQTLRATIDWSHNLLDEAEKECFARFAVFAGGATIEAAETVTRAPLDTLDHLVAKNLLVRRHDQRTQTRLRMLETIRAFAGERLALTSDRHDDSGAPLPSLPGAGPTARDRRALWSAGGEEHLARLDADIDNLHAALGWAIEQADAERALALAAAMGRYWVMRNRHADALEWLERTLGLRGADAHPAMLVRALLAKSECLWKSGRGTEQAAVIAELVTIARRLGDPLILSQALRYHSDHETGRERLHEADVLADEALHWATATGDEWEIAEASRQKAVTASNIADLRERVDTAASLLSDVGNVHQLASMLTSAAFGALCLGSDRDATEFADRATRIVRALDTQPLRMINSGNLGLAALLTGETEAASRAFREELVLCRDMVIRPVAFEGLRGLAAVAVTRGDAKRAAALAGAADAHRYDQLDSPVDVRLDEIYFEPARARCGKDAWDAAARDGGALSFEEAIAYAIGEQPA